MKNKIGNSNISIVVLLLVGTMVLINLNVVNVSAQLSYQWAFQRQIPDYDNHSRAPFLVADQNHTVHAFNIQPIEQDEDGLFYRQWSVERGWTSPIDILLPPRTGTFSIQDIFLDQSGFFHMVFFQGDPESGSLYFTSAHASVAGQARSWSQPLVISSDAGPLGSASMIHEDNGVIVVIFAGRKDGIGVYEVRSPDNGLTWSSPQSISIVFEEELWPFSVKVTKDQAGELHAVWSIVNVRGLGEAIFYSRSSFTENRWSEPYLLADLAEEEYSTNFPSIIEHNDELFVMYQDSSPATRWMRRSYDGGRNWTVPVRPFLIEGEYEAAVLLEDSTQTLHMILGNRTKSQVHGMWHSVWTGERWTELVPIVSGPKTDTFDPSAPKAVISQGNVLLASWWTDTSNTFRNGAWYSYAVLDVPELPVVSIPTLPALSTPSQTDLVIPVQTPTSTPTLRPAFLNNDENENLFVLSPGIPIMLSIIPVLVFVVVVIRVRNLQKHPSSH